MKDGSCALKSESSFSQLLIMNPNNLKTCIEARAELNMADSKTMMHNMRMGESFGWLESNMLICKLEFPLFFCSKIHL